MTTDNHAASPGGHLILTANRDVTGRDSYIMTKGLAYAIAAIQSLPEHLREESDCDDMISLLCALVPDERVREHIAEGVRADLGRRPDLTPPGDGP